MKRRCHAIRTAWIIKDKRDQTTLQTRRMLCVQSLLPKECDLIATLELW